MSISLPGKPFETGGSPRNLAILGALCLFLSAVEYMIPKPLPFLRIGLANLPLMLALGIFPLRSFLVLVCIKVFGQAIITGTLFSYIFLFSLTGTFLSALLMFLLRFLFGKRHITFVGIGTAGAFVSNISQLALAHVFIFKENVFYIAPPFLAAGLVTGIVLGVFCGIFTQRSKWFLKLENREEEPGIGNEELGNKKNDLHSLFLLIAGFLIMPALLFNPVTQLRVLQFLFFWLLALLYGKKTNPLFTILLIVFIIAFNLIIPYGRVLFSIGAFKITSGALTAGVHRAFTLAALVMLSKFTISKDLKLPGTFGNLLSLSLRIFSFLMGRKYRITGKNFITEIDNLMLELSQEPQPIPDTHKVRTKPAGYVILIIIILLSWLPWLMN